MMASSSYNHNLIPYIVGTLGKIQFSSLLDVGTGFGKMGVLIREYFDLSKARCPKDLLRENWRLRIEGIEAFPPFIGDLHRYAYDKMYIGEAPAIVDGLGHYDVILMIAVLAHFPEGVGLSLVQRLYDHADRALILTIPTVKWPQTDIFQNPYEVHHDDVKWWKKDFSFAEYASSRDLPQGERILVFSRKRRITVANPYGRRIFTTGRREMIKKFIGEERSKQIALWLRSKKGL